MSAMQSSSLLCDADTLVRHVRPGPRYTSYPPATEFHAGFTAAAAAAELERIQRDDAGAPISLYCHIPFCRTLCWYCGCNVIATSNRQRGLDYLDLLCQEIELVAGLLGPGRALAELSLGGGSPSFLPPAALRRLASVVAAAFEIRPDAELGIELDPRDTSGEQIAALAACGFTRLSVGVQDFSEDVQEAIHRHQSVEQTARLLEDARARGFRAVNCDLVYGLPRQTPESFATTLDAVVAMQPDRIALFGYAHMPHLRPHQKLVERFGALPDVSARAALLSVALERFAEAGYVRVGMDHFALPHDALARAAADRTLHRNFQGYVVARAPYLVGCGVTGISDSGHAYWQNHTGIDAWAADVQAGRLPVARGVALDQDDRIRRSVINRLMCDGACDLEAVTRAFGVPAQRYFAAELAALQAAELAELAVVDGGRIQATPLGQNLIRNVAMVFDRYLGARSAQAGAAARPRFSATL